MAHQDAKLIPIAEWSKGVNQAPGFMAKARGAAEEMENLIIGLQGRPQLRKGYTLLDRTGGLLGTTDGHYHSGEELVVAHWLGDDDVPSGIKRIYLLPRDSTWVQDEPGRLMYIVNPDAPPRFVDIKKNVVYDWDLTRPVSSGNIVFGNITMDHEQLPGVRHVYNEQEQRLQNLEIVTYFDAYLTAWNNRFWIVLNAATDITYAEIKIDGTGLFDRVIRTIYAGPLEAGSYIWLWDKRNDDGVIHDDNGRVSVKLDVEPAEGREFVKPTEPDGVLDPPDADAGVPQRDFGTTEGVEAERFYAVQTPRFLVATYANPQLGIETRPSKIEVGSAWDIIDNTLNRQVRISTTLQHTQLWGNAPDWVNQIRIYASVEPVPLDYDYEEAIESGFDFRKIAEFDHVLRGDDTHVGEVPIETIEPPEEPEEVEVPEEPDDDEGDTNTGFQNSAYYIRTTTTPAELAEIQFLGVRRGVIQGTNVPWTRIKEIKFWVEGYLEASYNDPERNSLVAESLEDAASALTGASEIRISQVVNGVTTENWAVFDISTAWVSDDLATVIFAPLNVERSRGRWSQHTPTWRLDLP